jgi:hypothetical protein
MRSKLVLVFRTLNLSGPQLNPFEFFSTRDESDIVTKMHRFINPRMNTELYNTEGEQYYTKRYSVLRSPLLEDLKQNMPKKVWDQKWNDYLQKLFKDDPEYKSKLTKAETKELEKLTGKVNSVEELRAKIRDFDYFMFQEFHAFLRSYPEYRRDVFGVYDRSFLEESKKTMCFVESVFRSPVSVYFLQEISTSQYALLKTMLGYKYSFSPADTSSGQDFSVILYDGTLFGTMEVLDLGIPLKETVVLKNENVILISSHFPSKPNKKDSGGFGYQQQFINLFSQLATRYMGDFHIYVGMDANHDISKKEDICKDETLCEPILEQYDTLTHLFKFSDIQKQPTTNKMRTCMQPQLSKVEKHDFATKDYIVTSRNLPTLKCSVETLREKETDIQKHFIPNDSHPTDHFVVSAIM